MSQLLFFVKKETTNFEQPPFMPTVGECLILKQRRISGGCGFKIFSTEMKALGRSNEEHLQQTSLCKQPTQIYANANAL